MGQSDISLPGHVLSISIVCFQPDLPHLQLLFQTLSVAVQRVTESGKSCQTTVIDHGVPDENVARLCAAYQATLAIQFLMNPDNPGFGAGHNQAIAKADSEYHLILNPDVVLPENSLSVLLEYLEAHPEVVAVCPEVRNETGKLQYLCKRQPAMLDLVLRGFAPVWVKKLFAPRLANYECREIIDKRSEAEVELMSGCFMLCRTAALKAEGFDEGYFLYFEDFALSQQLKKYGQLQYCPRTCIVHFGGNTANKGVLHIRYFIASAWRYFSQFGWRVW